MRGIIAIVLAVLLVVPFAFSLTGPFTNNGKEYYVVFGDTPTEDTGNEVCGLAGKVCVGYTEPTTAVCKKAHTNAAESSSWSGDRSGVYCNGSPQSGVCAAKTNTCHTCPQCTATVDCGTPVGGLYKEMYVECAAPTPAGSGCSVNLQARNTQALLSEIPSLNVQLQQCPQSLPSGSSIVVSNGNTLVNIQMNAGNTEQITITIQNKKIAGIRRGGGACKQQVSISENDLNTVLASSNRGTAAAILFATKKFTLKGCTFITRIKTGIVGPISRFFVRRNTPSTTPPPAPPPPPPNCGQVGEQCNNRGCFSGMCGAPNERNSGGQWGHWNYRCMDQAQYTANCIGRGNTPPAWSCLTGPCR